MKWLAVLAVLLAPQASKPTFSKDVAGAKSKAASEWRPACLIFYGDATGKENKELRKAVEDWFERADVEKASAPFVCAVLSIAANKKDAEGFKIATGPVVIILDPSGKEMGRSTAKDGAAFASCLPPYSKDYVPVDPKFRKSVPEALQSIRNNKSRELVFAASLHADTCKECEKFIELLKHRRMIVPLRRLILVRQDPEADKEALAAAGLTEAHKYTILQAGEKDADPFKVVDKPASLPTDARRMQESLLELYKSLDEKK